MFEIFDFQLRFFIFKGSAWQADAFFSILTLISLFCLVHLFSADSKKSEAFLSRALLSIFSTVEQLMIFEDKNS